MYLPAIDRKLIRLADELDFVLIQMPPSKELRYADVISDVTECLHRERSRSDLLVSDILARMSTLPLHQRTIHASLRMISDAIMASVLLLDESDHLLNQACWPQSMEPEIRTMLPTILPRIPTDHSVGSSFSDSTIYSSPVVPDTGIPMRLLVIKQGETIPPSALEQVTDVARICINIWGKGYNNIAIRELIRAILQDDPLKMHRLADIFHIQISNIHEMWILSGDTAAAADILKLHAHTLRDYLESCCSSVFSDIYEDRLLLFSSTPYSLQEAESTASAMLELLRPLDPSITLVKCSNLRNTTEVRSAWLTHEHYLADARKIFPLMDCFRSGQLAFSRECRSIIESGEDRMLPYLSALTCGNTAEAQLVDEATLSAYMLDADFKVTRAAELLHVHPNTVKYRLKTIDDQLGFRHDIMPDSMQLYYALGIRRLLHP